MKRLTPVLLVPFMPATTAGTGIRPRSVTTAARLW
jgi:hypothetical protein